MAINHKVIAESVVKGLRASLEISAIRSANVKLVDLAKKEIKLQASTPEKAIVYMTQKGGVALTTLETARLKAWYKVMPVKTTTEEAPTNTVASIKTDLLLENLLTRKLTKAQKEMLKTFLA